MIDVTVIIPTFNRRQFLPIALESVFNQRNVCAECIVIDDCSNDGSVEFIRERYKDQELVVIEKLRRSGPQSSRNLGIMAARGDFIVFLDSDDYFEPDSLFHRVNLCRTQELDALFSGYQIKFVGRYWSLVKSVQGDVRLRPIDYPAALLNFKIAHTISILYRRSAYPNLKLDELLVSGHDDELSLNLIRSGRHSFDDKIVGTVIHHVGERVATPRNLMIGDAQLLQRYAKDIAFEHGQDYLNRRKAEALAGLWSIGHFKSSAFLLENISNRFSKFSVLIFSLIYLPRKLLELLYKNVLMATVRALL
jgi:glycosyltransferase involved in cell wall biosynthesis